MIEDKKNKIVKEVKAFKNNKEVEFKDFYDCIKSKGLKGNMINVNGIGIEIYPFDDGYMSIADNRVINIYSLGEEEVLNIVSKLEIILKEYRIKLIIQENSRPINI
jgi:hypothetical protein